jgi:glucose-fructose oxidoreductase
MGMAGASLAFGAYPGKSREQRLGVALVGLGSYSTYQLAPALQQTKYCHLAGIVTGTPSKIPLWQRKYGIPDSCVYNYENMHEIADNDQIDIIYIVVPTGLHARYAIEAANAGKHVFCEKPMAMNVKECQSIIEACRKNKVRLAIGYRMQHEPNTQMIMQMAQERPYGKIIEVNAEACYFGGTGTGWRFQKEMGGGALYDMGVYSINGIRYATGEEPRRILWANQSTKRAQWFTEVDETTTFAFEFSSGIQAKGKTSVGESGNRLRVDCEHGWYELRPMQAYSGVRGNTSDGKHLDAFIANQQARQMDDDALAILNEKPMLVPGEEGMRDIHLVQKILESAGKKAPIDV